VLQISVLACMAVIGMTLRQLPSFAFRSQTDYSNEMDRLHGIYDGTLGTGLVNALEQLQLFRVFSSVWFSIGLVVLILSIVACTIDRLPRLWRQSADIRVVQPDAYFDPTLPDRAVLAGVDADATARILRRHRFVVRREAASGATYLYGDRHRWTKMATLLTHTGLVMFLVAAAVTSRLGDEQGLVVAEGESLTVQPIGTPGLLLVRNLEFEAPGFDTGHPSDFTTHLAVYQDGKQIADKVIRVNDPLTVDGYTFHQNGFGPAPDVVIRDSAGKPLWTGPVPMTDSAAGFPFTEMAVPGRDVALQLLLQKADDGTGILLVLPFRAAGTNADGTPNVVGLQPLALAKGESGTSDGTDFSIELRGFSDYTLLIAKKDPGQGIIWAAFAFLISGIVISFWLPRRRVWGRLDADGRLSLVMRADRYVDAGREFGRLLDDLVAARRAPSSDGAAGT
jgi:cytochrome c biogenesis protein